MIDNWRYITKQDSNMHTLLSGDQLKTVPRGHIFSQQLICLIVGWGGRQCERCVPRRPLADHDQGAPRTRLRHRAGTITRWLGIGLYIFLFGCDVTSINYFIHPWAVCSYVRCNSEHTECPYCPLGHLFHTCKTAVLPWRQVALWSIGAIKLILKNNYYIKRNPRLLIGGIIRYCQ